MKINTKTIRNMFEKACGLMVAGAGLMLLGKMNQTMTLDINRMMVDATYGGAVKTIMDSDMFDSRKEEALQILKREGDAEYYKAVISVINSDMFDSRKIDVLKTL